MIITRQSTVVLLLLDIALWSRVRKGQRLSFSRLEHLFRLSKLSIGRRSGSKRLYWRQRSQISIRVSRRRITPFERRPLILCFLISFVVTRSCPPGNGALCTWSCIGSCEADTLTSSQHLLASLTRARAPTSTKHNLMIIARTSFASSSPVVSDVGSGKCMLSSGLWIDLLWYGTCFDRSGRFGSSKSC